MNQLVTTFYKLPVHTIPFHSIPSLEGYNSEYSYFSSLPIQMFMGLDYHLVSVYDVFDENIVSADNLQSRDLLFGSVVCEKLSTRGKTKCIQVDSVESIINKENLPHLKYSSNAINPLQSNWFYMKDGRYFIMESIASEYSKVKHLEGISLYGDSILRLRIVIELLKRNAQDGLVTLTAQDYKDIAYEVFKADPTFAKTKDDMLEDGINNWIPSMLITPLYRDITKETRGKVIL